MKSLFDTGRSQSKTADSKIAKKTNSGKRKSSVTVKGGGIASRIKLIIQRVQELLGKYEEDYLLITEEKTLKKYVKTTLEDGVFAIDTETTGLDPLLDKIVGVCLYSPSNKPSYIPLRHKSYITGEYCKDQLPVEKVASLLKPLESVPDIRMFNAKFDTRFMRADLGVDLVCTWDGYLAARCMNENEESTALKRLHSKYVLKGQEDEFTFGELFKGIEYALIPPQTAKLYAAHDAVITMELTDWQKKYLYYDPEKDFTARNGMNGVSWVFLNIEMPCYRVVAEMEDTGIAFDLEYARSLSTVYKDKLQEKLQAFYDFCNQWEPKITQYKKMHPQVKLDSPINIGSPAQLAVLLYDILQLPSESRGTGVEVLQELDHPIVKTILEYREVEKLLSTYIDKLPDCINPNDKRIHCSFNQYGADTGRFSSSDPNLQNIPSHNKDIRKMFTASDGYVLMSSDYSQQEPKVMTQMCGDEKMLSAYQHGRDLYAAIAAIAFNTDYENCLEFYPDGSTNKEGKERRSSAKSILLGILYGRGIKSIAKQLNTTLDKAKLIQDKIFKGFPAIPKFERDSLQMVRDYGFVTTLWGRKRRLPNYNLPEFEFRWKAGMEPDPDILDFDVTETSREVPEKTQKKYLSQLKQARGFTARNAIIARAAKEGVIITDNGAKIAAAKRQIVNARIQGSAADMSKLAMIAVGTDPILKELGFRLLVPVHDELIGEAPKENAKAAAERFAELMSGAAGSRLTVPITCDVEITEQWYGEKVAV